MSGLSGISLPARYLHPLGCPSLLPSFQSSSGAAGHHHPGCAHPHLHQRLQRSPPSWLCRDCQPRGRLSHSFSPLPLTCRESQGGGAASSVESPYVPTCLPVGSPRPGGTWCQGVTTTRSVCIAGTQAFPSTSCSLLHGICSSSAHRCCWLIQGPSWHSPHMPASLGGFPCSLLVGTCSLYQVWPWLPSA